MNDDKPTLEYDDNYKEWTYILDGTKFYHRIDKPARIWSSGSKEWYQHDKLHRLDGPACIYFRGQQGRLTPQVVDIDYIWFVDGKNITYEIDEWIKRNKLPKWQKWTDEIKMLFKLTFA